MVMRPRFSGRASFESTSKARRALNRALVELHRSGNASERTFANRLVTGYWAAVDAGYEVPSWLADGLTPAQQELEREMRDEWAQPLTEAGFYAELLDGLDENEELPPYGTGYTFFDGPTTFKADEEGLTEAFDLLPYGLAEVSDAITAGRHRSEEQRKVYDLAALALAAMDASPTAAARLLGHHRDTIYRLKGRGVDLLEQIRETDARIERKLDDLCRLILNLNSAHPADAAEQLLAEAE